MQRVLAAAAGAALARAVSASTVNAAGNDTLPPRLILYILSDDVGYGDVGWASGQAGAGSPTPRLDALAAEGVVLDQHMAHFMCTPSRSSLLSGRLPVHVQQGQAFPETPSCGIPRNMTTLPGKLRSMGWANHVAGKWDVSIASSGHTPEGRGFDTSLIYAEHMIDAWTQNIFPGGTACTLVDPTIVDLWDSGAPARSLNGTGFADFLFRDRVQSLLNASDPLNGQPQFIYWAPHILHYPQQVPADVLAAVPELADDEPFCNATTPYIFPGPGGADPSLYSCRRQGLALMRLLDALVGNVTDSIKARPGLWERTLVVFASDNGAPLDVSEAAGNNWLLRGGKYAPWQGGVRTPAFVSGGALPPAVRGSHQPALVHIADWMATLCGLAGGSATFCASDPVAAAYGLPPIDSLDVWPLLSGQAPASPRTEVPIAPGALVQYREGSLLKLVTGPTWWSGYAGPVYPNASSPSMSPDTWALCGDGCLYDINADPFETVDLAPSMPQVVANMSARLTELAQGFYQNNETGIDICPPGTLLCGCWAAVHTWGGYFGPYQY